MQKSCIFFKYARYEIEELFSPNQKSQNMKIGVEAIDIMLWYLKYQLINNYISG